MKFVKAHQRSILYLFFTMIISFLIGYLCSCTYNYYNSIYICNFTSQETINEQDLLTLEKLSQIKDSHSKYENIDVNYMIDHRGIYLEKLDENTYTITTYSRYYDNFFLKDKQIVSTRAKTFIKDLLNTNYSDIKFSDPDNIIESKNFSNNYLIGLLVMIPLTLLMLIYIIIKTKQQSLQSTENISLSIFTLDYWKQAKNIFSSPKKITTLAMIFSLLIISKMIKIPSGFSNLGIGFGYIFFSIIGIMFGPLAGLLIGFLSDILGYFLFDASGASFFIGYVFQAVISGFIHGIFLYQKRITFFRILLLRISIALICNILIGSFCWGFVAGYNLDQTISYMILFVIPKNIIYLIPQSIILFVICKAIAPVLTKFGFINEKISQNITLL